MPSQKTIDSKKLIVDGLAEQMNGAIAGVVLDFTGITVADDTAMRKELREAGVHYRVAKNTLIGRACDQLGYGDMKQYLEGNTGFAISKDDPITAAKIIKKYTDKIESIDIKGGFYDGKVVDAEMVKQLADTPSKEDSIGRLLGSLQSGLYNLAYALQAIVDRGDMAKPADAAAPAAEATAAE